MQSDIRLIPESEYFQVAQINYNAYPFKVLSIEERQALVDRYKDAFKGGYGTAFYGLYRQEQMLGLMKVFDFSMNLHGKQVLLAGVGSVAVDLLHKKEKVCKEMIQFFLQHYRDKGACIAGLYAFNLAFYRRMGFGFGNKMSQYLLETTSLPPYPKKHLRFYKEEDFDSLKNCRQNYVRKTHGMILRPPRGWKLLENPDYRIVVYEPSKEKIEGYLIFRFQMRDDQPYVLQVIELIYLNPQAFQSLLGFLRTQADQAARIKINTQDDDFHFLSQNPKSESPTQIYLHHQSNVSEVGIMYRILNVKDYFQQMAHHNFGGKTLRVAFDIEDDFLEANNDRTVIYFEEGKAKIQTNDAPADVSVRMKIAEFSALAMGTIGVQKLHRYGMLEISNEDLLEGVDGLFDFREKPKCVTLF